MAYASQSKENPNPQQSTKAAAQTFSDNRESTSVSLPLQAMMANSPQQQKLKSTTQLMVGSPVQQKLNISAKNFANKSEPMQRMEEEESLQGKFESEPAQLEASPDAPRPNNTGLPDNLKSGIENLSGMSMDHVRVYYNSDKPAQLQAHAYAQGCEIHVAPGQEKHLPHEAWHVVQQAQGRVKPTTQMKPLGQVNDEVGLESEANLLGNKDVSGVTQRNVIQRVISADEKGQLTTIEGQIDAALQGAVLHRRGIVNFTLPNFVQVEIQVPREDIPDGSFNNLLVACQRYLAMVNRANGLAAVVEFERLVGTLGNTYQAYDGEKTAIRTQHQADNHGVFLGADPSDARVGQVDTKIKALNGKILEREGTTLETTIAGGVERNRQAGPEVNSVHNMLSLMMLEVKRTTGVYKSPHDDGVGHLGAEWSIKAGATSNFPKAKEKAETLSKNWVLHGHVANVRGNKFTKKISNLNADHFHLKDKDTAGGPDGPSVVVNSGDVRAPAEASLKNYMEQINDRNNTWRSWIENEYIQPD